MGADANHDGTCDEIGGRHLSMLLVEVVVDDEPKEPGHAAGDVEQGDGTLECVPFNSIGHLIRLFRAV